MTPRGSAAASPSRIGSPCSATQPVSPSPIATRSVPGSGSALAEERALEGDRLAHPGLVVDPVDPDRVVGDERAGLGDDRLADALDVLEPAEPAGRSGDRAQPAARSWPSRRAGRCRSRSPCGRRRRGRGALVLGPLVGVAVVQHEQAERLVPEDDRARSTSSGRRAGRSPAAPAVSGSVAAHDPDVALADRLHAQRCVSLGRDAMRSRMSSDRPARRRARGAGRCRGRPTGRPCRHRTGRTRHR